MRTIPFILAIASGALLAACSTAAVDSAAKPASTISLESDLFGKRPSIISTTEIHSLSDDQRLAFQEYFDDPGNRDTAPHKRVFNYLESITSSFSYLGETNTASEALEQAAGNCLALAVVTTGLAKLADVDVEYQLIDSAPVFESRGNLIRRSLHVRTILLDSTWEAQIGSSIRSRPSISIDYFPSKFSRVVRKIDEPEYFAMFYRNIAADAMEANDLGQAYWLLMESLELSPASPESLNMLAIVFDRAGDQAKSEEIYQYGIEHAERRVSLLRNYAIFLRRAGRDAEADEVDSMLARESDPNPFDWLYAGQEAYEDGDFRRAISLFEKSVELAPYLHEGHFGLARSYYQLGDMRRAEHELEQALNQATSSTSRLLYEAKLAALSEIRSR